MRPWKVALIAGLVFTPATALAAPPALTPADKAAAFKAAGFKPRGKAWVRCDDTVTASHQDGWLEADDLNGDGLPEAWVKESSTYCYGNTAEAFVLVTKRPTGWAMLLDEVGVAVPQATRRSGWPDIEVGGPGSGPFPVFRYDGKTYVPRR